MDMPYGIGCTLVKDRLAHYTTFVYGHEAEYLKTAFDQAQDQLVNPHNLALPLSRSFPSLKAYMLLRAYGQTKYRRLVQQNIDQTNYLAELIRKDARMEITAPVVSNIVCFRYRPKGLTEQELTRLNREICDEVSRRSHLMISDTTIKGRYMLRACSVNHRTRKEDLHFLVSEVKAIGNSRLS
jgi:glutamate/tyrosine decarboxylase-like PLP-dependent enzyme